MRSDHRKRRVMPDLGSSTIGWECFANPQRGEEMCITRVVAQGTCCVVPVDDSSCSASRRIASWWASLRSRDPRSTSHSDSKQHLRCDGEVCILHDLRFYMMHRPARGHRTWTSCVLSVGDDTTPRYVSVTYLLLQWLQARRA